MLKLVCSDDRARPPFCEGILDETRIITVRDKVLDFYEGRVSVAVGYARPSPASYQMQEVDPDV
jgi:hypothetical protein